MEKCCISTIWIPRLPVELKHLLLRQNSRRPFRGCCLASWSTWWVPLYRYRRFRAHLAPQPDAFLSPASISSRMAVIIATSPSKYTNRTISSGSQRFTSNQTWIQNIVIDTNDIYERTLVWLCLGTRASQPSLRAGFIYRPVHLHLCSQINSG